MGVARLKRQQRERNERLSKRIPVVRFDHYALGTRLSVARLASEELSWWADMEENLLGVVFRDTTDRDYGWVLLARDGVGRFRASDLQVSLRSERYATVRLREAIAQAATEENASLMGVQGDEPNEPFDLLRVPTDMDTAKLHPYFKELLVEEGREPARAVVREIGPWLAPSDPHFVEEFQCRQFDQRLWELYLWAAFRELGFDVTQTEAPDFKCRAPGIEFTIEATTVAPSQAGPLAAHPNPRTHEELERFNRDYMPMKFGSSLMSKVNKTDAEGRHYWEREDTAGKPFLIAVADFHKQAEQDRLGSMTYSQSAIWRYLYGQGVKWEVVEGRLVAETFEHPRHVYGTKTVPTGFFDQPGAEHVSAVLFSNAGTIAKFDRMGVVAGFGAANHHYQRIGYRYDPNPDAVKGIAFSEDVAAPTYTEGWSDELQIFHNPNARVPLPHEWLMGLAQFAWGDGELKASIPEDQVIASATWVFRPKPAE